MNAGRGRDYAMTVFDFLERVSYVEGDNAVHVAADEIERGHRWTRFTGIHGRLIVSAVFRFRPGAYEGDPVADRLAYARKHQDLTAPSCGSVFADCSATVQTKLRGLRIGTACYSAKATNWILNLGDDPRPVCALIAVSRALHALVGKRAILEIVAVE
jgi:UDP-N-acetylmuramate dehydrogenase